MKKLVALLAIYGLVLTPLHASAAAVRSAAAPASPGSSPADAGSLLEAAEIAAVSGVYRAQNTATITTGQIRRDDKKRSAIAFALSGALAFVGAALWRNLTCRGGGDARHFGEGLKTQVECYEDDGSRKGWDTPTRALFAAGVGLEVVSLFYLMAHLRQGDEPDDQEPQSQ